jgi:hypothetical protein
VVLVCCLIADPHRHDDLVVAIDRCLEVVVLDPAVPTFEDVAVWIRIGGAFRAAVIALGAVPRNNDRRPIAEGPERLQLVAYYRVTTERQGQSGLGLEA